MTYMHFSQAERYQIQAPELVFEFLNFGHQRNVHDTEFGKSLIKRGVADSALFAHIQSQRISVGLHKRS
jgi:hypothetical protein